MTELALEQAIVQTVGIDSADPLFRATAGWLAAYQNSPHTQGAYRRDVTGIGANGKPATHMRAPAWLPWCMRHDLDPLTVRRSHVDVYGHVLKSAGCFPATIARKLSAVSSWYDYLTDEGLIDANPAKRATRPAIDRDVSPATGLSQDELNRLLDAAEADSPRSLALLSLLYFGALRVGSVLGARIDDLGWDEGQRTLRLTVKGGTVRRPVLEDEAADALDAYLATRGEPEPDGPLFASVTGAPLDEKYVWRLVRRLAQRAAIPAWTQLSPHSLRHSHITHARDEGVPLDVVQETAGHKDGRTTLRYDRARFRRNRRSGTVLSERRRQAKEARNDG